MLWRDSKAHFIVDFLISGYDGLYKLLRLSKITIFDIVMKTVRTIHGVRLKSVTSNVPFSEELMCSNLLYKLVIDVQEQLKSCML